MDVLAAAAAAATPATSQGGGEGGGAQAGVDAAVTLAAAFATSEGERKDAFERATREAAMAGAPLQAERRD
jgi:hypothetical protein